MSVFDDFEPCPALHRWLLPRWEGKVVGAWMCGSRRRWRAPRALRRMLGRAGAVELLEIPEPASLDVLVVVSPLAEGELVPDEIWTALRAGGELVDLATARRRGVGDVLRPWVYAQRLREATARRVRAWLERGAFGPEQWVAVEPAGVVVTMVEKSVLPGR